MKNLTVVFYLILVTCIGHAQTNYDIDEVEVVSLSIPVSVDESGRNITILTQGELEKYPFTSIDEILRFQAGINTNSRGGFGVQSDLGMRGSTFSQVLILIDGVRFNEPLTSHLNFSLPIPINEISQIEIIRGPASALYGADAVGGMIHIKTKAYTNTNQGLNTSGYLFGGQERLIDGDASISYDFGKVKLSGAMKHTSSDGQTFRNPNFDLGFNENEEYQTDFDIQSYTMAASYRPTEDWLINARYGIDDRDFNAKYFYTRSGFDESRETTSTNLAQLSVRRAKNQSETNLNIGYREGTDFFVFNPLFSANDHQTERLTGLLRHSITNDKGYTFGFGAQFENQEIISTDRGNHEQSQTDAYFTALLPLWDDFTIMASQRFGMNDDYGVSYTPQMSASYHKNNFILRSSAGWAVRGPDFTERYVSDLIPSLSPGRNIGNPDLLAEESFTIDLGGSYLPSASTKLDASVFIRDSKNLVDFVLTNANEITTANNLQYGEEYFYSKNVSEATTWGIEFQGNHNLSFSERSNLNLQANYTFLNTELADGSISRYIANHPNHQLNANAQLSVGKVQAFLGAQWIDRDEQSVEAINALVQSDYFVGHAKLGYQMINGLQLQLRMNNVFDESYQEILGSELPRRWTSLGVQWDLQ